MTTIQRRNAEMVALLQADLLPATDRNLAAEFYNSATGTTFTGTVTAPLDTTRLNLATGLFSLVSNALTIAQAGIYRLAYHATVGHSTGSSEAVVDFWLDQDPATTVFAEVPATKTFVRIPGTSWGSGGAVCILRAYAGYRYRIIADRDSGSDTLQFLAQGVRLSVECLYLMP